MGTSHPMDYDVHRMTSNWFSASSSCNIIWSQSYSTQTMWNRLDTANLWSHVDNTLKMWRNVMFSKEAGWEQTLRTLCQLVYCPNLWKHKISTTQPKKFTFWTTISLDCNLSGLSHTRHLWIKVLPQCDCAVTSKTHLVCLHGRSLNTTSPWELLPVSP